MSRRDKALDRLLQKPADFSWSELTTVMLSFGFELKKSGGSARKFIHRETRATLMMHQPHPSNVLKQYQVKAAIDFLRQEKYIP